MNTKLYALSGFAVVIALAACIIAGTASSRVYKKLQADTTDSSGKMDLLNSRVTKIELQLRNISSTLVNLTAAEERRANIAERIRMEENTPESLNEYIVAINDAMYQLEEIVDASGLKSIGTNLAADPTILKNLYDDQARRKREREYRTAMTQLNATQRQTDQERYGEEFQTLYEATRFQFGGRGGRGGRNQDQNMTREEREAEREKAQAAREKAVNELIEKYPDSHTAGMLIAETGIRAAFRDNLEEAEKYYAMLMENNNRAQAVTDRGMKAAPTMQYALASQYIEAGRIAEAEELIYQLEQSEDDMIRAGGGRGRRGRGGYQTTQEAASRLRERIKERE